MFGAILNATNSSFQRCMTFCRSIYVRKVMKLLAFIFEQPSYIFMDINETLEIRGGNLGKGKGYANKISYISAARCSTLSIWYQINAKT